MKRKSLAYLVGLIGGDGSLSKDGKGNYEINIVDPSFEFLQTVTKLFEETLNIKAKIYVMKTALGNICYRIRIWSKKLYNFLIKLGVPEGRTKTFQMKTPEWIMNSGSKTKASYIGGWMDAEGCITRKVVKKERRTYIYPRIAMHVVNKTIRDELAFLLKDLGLKFSTWNSGKMYGLQINGFNNTDAYFRKIYTYHPKFTSR